MKNVSVIVLVVFGLLFAAYAEAAKPKRRSRNANRVGPYAGALIGNATYTGDRTQDEADLEDTFDGIPTQDLTIGTDDKDLGYQAAFGYRFNRYLAAEFELVQYGELNTGARANADLGDGFVPVSIDLNFHSGGPQLAVLGILPINEKFELFAKAGVLFASSEREFVVKVEGDTSSFGSVKGDSTNGVFGVGGAWNVNQMYSIRAQYERVDGVGEKGRTQTEDITIASIGLIVRF
jgi:opacity protein-like surface antigen